MSKKTADKFIEALGKLEKNEDTETIASLFADSAEIGNVTLIKNVSNPKEFWTNYRKTFGEVSSEFTNKIHSENVSALEWTTAGTSASGGEINYGGVSVLEFDESDKIKRFFAYFNPAKLGHQIEEAKANAG